LTAPTAELGGVAVFRTDRIPAYGTAGLSVRASDVSLLSTLDVKLIHGTFLNEATARYPAVVLGYEAARGLGIGDVTGDARIWLGNRWYAVIGILRPVELVPEIDRSAVIAFSISPSPRMTSAMTATRVASTCAQTPLVRPRW
jgi:putative ABC transport system permease protein